MTASEVIDAANVIAPHMKKICVLNVTTSSARFDLSSVMAGMASTSGPTTDEYAMGILTLVADGGKVYFFMNSSNAGTVDEAAHSGSTPDNSCMMIPDGGRMDFRLNPGFPWIVVKGSAAAKLRIYRSSATGESSKPK